MSAFGITRVIFLILAALFTFLAVILSVVAIVTPAWQVVYLKEFHTEHEHGLWLDCVRGKKHVEGSRADSQHCTYKFESRNHYFPDENLFLGGGEVQHKFFPWHKAVLGLIIVSIFCGLIAVCFLLCASCVKICAIVFCVFVLFSTLLSILSLGVFFINSHQYQFRFVIGISNTYEQSKGYSFWLELIAIMLFSISFVLGIVATVLLFVHDWKQNRPTRTCPKHKTSV